MPRPFSKRLVIDASVARASGGEDATFPSSKHCRDFLHAVRDHGHRVVFSPPLSAEWKRHESGFARGWRVDMVQRRRVLRVDLIVCAPLRDAVEDANTALTDQQRAAVRKDCHLIESALLADRSVAALDDRVRRLFIYLAALVTELRPIVWVNPSLIAEDQPIVWIQQGAPPEAVRRLGHAINDP